MRAPTSDSFEMFASGNSRKLYGILTLPLSKRANSALIVMRHPAGTVFGGVHEVFFGAHGGSRRS